MLNIPENKLRAGSTSSMTRASSRCRTSRFTVFLVTPARARRSFPIGCNRHTAPSAGYRLPAFRRWSKQHWTTGHYFMQQEDQIARVFESAARDLDKAAARYRTAAMLCLPITRPPHSLEFEATPADPKAIEKVARCAGDVRNRSHTTGECASKNSFRRATIVQASGRFSAGHLRAHGEMST